MGIGVAAMVDELAVLTREECTFWSQKVITCHSLWRRRVRGIDYYSLGISYDVLSRHGGFSQDWKNSILRNNQEMCDAFDGLYKKVSGSFANFFGKPISLSKYLAVPGFNVFGSRPGSKPAFFNSVFFENGGNIHNHPTPDWMHEALGMSEREVPSIIYSFTIPLRLPELGSGLNVWPSEDISGPPSFLSYSEGIAYGFRGDLMHQVPPVRSYQKIASNECRITMQNHFLELEDCVIMFF